MAASATNGKRLASVGLPGAPHQLFGVRLEGDQAIGWGISIVTGSISPDSANSTRTQRLAEGHTVRQVLSEPARLRARYGWRWMVDRA